MQKEFSNYPVSEHWGGNCTSYPADGLRLLARIIARVHLARLADKAQAMTDNSQIDDKLNHQTNHEDIP
jgi:hypothetical protein